MRSSSIVIIALIAAAAAGIVAPRGFAQTPPPPLDAKPAPAQPAKKAALKSAVLILPLQAGAGIDKTKGEEWLGYAVSQILWHATLPDGRLAEPKPGMSWEAKNNKILYGDGDGLRRYIGA